MELPGSALVRPQSGAEVKSIAARERRGTPFVMYREPDGRLAIVDLAPDRTIQIGRSPDVDVALTWDDEVSLVHAQLQWAQAAWLLVDDGLSRNGTFVNGERVRGRRRLHERDAVRCGRTALVFRAPADSSRGRTKTMATTVPVELTPAQRRVLVALCRPFGHASTVAVPASNQAIAEELVISVESVRTHLKALFQKFGIGSLPQNQKRASLAQAALRSGVVSEREL